MAGGSTSNGSAGRPEGRSEGRSEGTVFELLVVAGADAGSRFTLEGDEILIGRGRPESGQTHVVRLRDTSISRRQAWLRRTPDGIAIEHIPSAPNPTVVNGIEIERTRIRPGDHIEMGRVAMDVRARGGMNISGLTEFMGTALRESTTATSLTNPGLMQGAPRIDPERTQTTQRPLSAPPDPAEEPTLSPAARVPAAAAIGAPANDEIEEVTEVRAIVADIGELELVRGLDAADSTRFPLGVGVMRIGRGEACEVRIPESGLSRVHAEIRLHGRAFVLKHRSKTNPTFLNGLPVLDEAPLQHGDEIQLADRIVLRLTLTHDRQGAVHSGRHSGFQSGLRRQMEEKIDIERRIEEFSVVGTFLDVDVVASREMKSRDEKAEHVIVSFERFRAFVGRTVEVFGGQVLNSNGDELMCYFEETFAAVKAGSAILARLPGFNRDENLLSRPFRFRIGVHTGSCLVDLEAGVAYSDILDTAGHIQKYAPSDGLLISQSTLDALPAGLPFAPAGEVEGEGEGLTVYRFDGSI